MMLTIPTMTPSSHSSCVSVEKSRKVRQNFTEVSISPNEVVPADPFMKPISIPPPATLRAAKLSPWWPQYKAATIVENDGHLKNRTWELVKKSSIPYGKSILRGKWVFDDKRDEFGKIFEIQSSLCCHGLHSKKGN